jgi:hypothetical protein
MPSVRPTNSKPSASTPRPTLPRTTALLSSTDTTVPPWIGWYGRPLATGRYRSARVTLACLGSAA